MEQGESLTIENLRALVGAYGMRLSKFLGMLGE